MDAIGCGGFVCVCPAGHPQRGSLTKNYESCALGNGVGCFEKLRRKCLRLIAFLHVTHSPSPIPPRHSYVRRRFGSIGFNHRAHLCSNRHRAGHSRSRSRGRGSPRVKSWAELWAGSFALSPDGSKLAWIEGRSLRRQRDSSSFADLILTKSERVTFRGNQSPISTVAKARFALGRPDSKSFCILL